MSVLVNSFVQILGFELMGLGLPADSLPAISDIISKSLINRQK
jgi:hypothetical protein